MFYFDRYHRYSEISFPRTDRVYFDPGAHEYNDLTLNQKLLDIAYMLTHGYDVRTFIHDTYKTKEYVSDNNVKQALYSLLGELWGSDNIKMSDLYEKKSLDELIDDFFSALKKSYHVPYNIKMPHFIKDLEKLSESELMEINPWRSVEIKYTGNSFLLSKKQYAYDEDLRLINEFNQSVSEEYQYKLNIPVYPWYGNPLTAKVIVLSQNPAWNEKQNIISETLLNLPSNQLELFTNHLRNMLIFKCDGFLPNNHKVDGVSGRMLANIHMSWYWEDRLKKAYGPENIDDVISKFAIIQYVAYSSKKFQPFKDNKLLPSQYFTRKLIQFIIHNKKDTFFIVPRNIERWKSFLGNIWTSNEDRFIEGHAYRSQSLKSIDEDNQQKIKRAFGLPETKKI